MRRDVKLCSHAHRFHAPRGAASSSRRSLSPPLRPRALLRGVGALNVLDQCSARSPRSVLEMVGASSRRTPRLQFPKHSRDRNAVGKRWGARGSIFRFFGPSCRLARGALEECVSGTLFLQLGWEEMQPVGALVSCGTHGKPPQHHAIPDGRQVGGPAPRRAPLPRRRVRRGCAEPAPPAGPSGAAGSRQPLGTPRSPPRPRGAANRAGERVTPLFLLEPPGPVAQRT